MNRKFRLTLTGGLAIAAIAALGVLSPSHSAAIGESTQGRSPVAQACSPDRFPSRVGNPISCCQDGNRTWHTNNGTTLSFREHAAACTVSDGVGTNCGDGSSPFVRAPMVRAGPGIEWSVTAEEVHIFKPVSKPGKCGWEVKNVLECRVGCDWPTGACESIPNRSSTRLSTAA